MQVTQAAKGQKAFYRSNNGGYGTTWQAGQTNDPTEVPQYRDLVSFAPSYFPYKKAGKWHLLANF